MITAAASAVTKIHENKRGASFMSSNLNKTRKEFDHTHARARLAPQISKLSPQSAGRLGLSTLACV